MKTNIYSGFHKLSMEERVKEVAEYKGWTEEDMEVLSKPGGLKDEVADAMIENVIGTYQLPIGLAMNFLINGKEYPIPMVVEEPSVVAAASNLAKLARECGGITTSYSGNIMISQIQCIDIPDPWGARMKILENKNEIIEIANAKDPVLVGITGGCKDIEVRVIDTKVGPMVITHLIVDTGDAMGANAVNTMAEAVAPKIEEITGGTVKLRILSNLAIYRIARAMVKASKEVLGGEDVVDGMVAAYEFAAADPFRAATNNKGIMNGIDAVVVATGNDWRAMEAGAHAYAAISGHYSPLAHYEKDANGDLVATIEIPSPLGLVGGATKIHPAAKKNIELMGITSAAELGQVVAAVGLMQNMGAVKALATDGIQRGHMKLHAKNMATVAGATPEQLDKVVAKMVADKNISVEYAKEILKEM